MKTIKWGAAGVLVAALAVSGCGSSKPHTSQAGKPSVAVSMWPAPATATEPAETVATAWERVTPILNGGCPDINGDCSQHPIDMVDAVDQARKAMNADPSGSAFYSPAYALIDQLDTLRENYEPLDQGPIREQVIGLVQQVDEWVRAHPSS